MEEQLIQEAGSGSAGDVSDAEASAVFLHLLRYLLVTERGEDLEFLGGLPPSWLRAGSRTALTDQLSEFGRFTLELRIGADGRTGHLTISPIEGRGSSGTVSCLLRALREGGFGHLDGTPLPERLSFPWRAGLDLAFRRL